MDKYYIPQSLDATFKIASFTIFEIVIVLLPFFVLSFGLHKPILALFISSGILILTKRIKGDEDSHFYKHFLYWHFPSLGIYQATPHSHVREILG